MKVIAVDLDLTLIDKDDKAITKTIEKVNRIFENSRSFIIIYTARCNKKREITEALLKEIGVKYHALVMEKMRADYYIDDRNSDLDTVWKEIVKI